MIDNQNIKQLLLQEILEKVKTHRLSGYQLSKLSDLSNVGIDKILDGRTKNPSLKNLEKIKDAIEAFESELHSPITLSSLDQKLDRVIGILECITDRMSLNEIDTDIMFEIIKTSFSTEEVKNIENKVKNKQANSSPERN